MFEKYIKYEYFIEKSPNIFYFYFLKRRRVFY